MTTAAAPSSPVTRARRQTRDDNSDHALPNRKHRDDERDSANLKRHKEDGAEHIDVMAPRAPSEKMVWKPHDEAPKSPTTPTMKKKKKV
jgi:hypothetical protein